MGAKPVFDRGGRYFKVYGFFVWPDLFSLCQKAVTAVRSLSGILRKQPGF